MNERTSPLALRAVFAASAATLLVAVACGGQSIRHVDDDGGAGEPDEPPPVSQGGSPGGDRGGAGAVGPSGGTGTSGSFAGGAGGTISVGGTGTGAVGVGGTSGTSNCTGVRRLPVPTLLQWDQYGTIYSNPFGVSGGFYTFDDCGDATLVNLSCTWRDNTLLGPDGAAGWDVGDAVCVRGVASQVDLGPDGTPAYSIQWGFGMGFSLNAGAPYDARSHCVRGFFFDITGNAPATIRINVATPETIGESHFVETPLGLGVALEFAAARQGSWVTNQVPLDTSRITDIQFHVYTDTAAPKPFDFCVSNVRLIY